jgi:acyl carrier protein
MDQISSQAIAIFRARADSALELGLETRLPDLHIESLDLALILLDLEDAFGIDFAYDPDEEADVFLTVGQVVARARSLIEGKRRRLAAGLASSFARPRSLWLAAGSRA